VRDDATVANAADLDFRRHSARRRLAVAGASGVVAGLVAASLLPWQLAVLIGWDVGAVVSIVRAWLHVAHLTCDETRRVATIEDNTRRGADAMLIGACLVSLGGVVLAFLKASESNEDWDVALKIAGITTIVLSWLLVHTIFTFKYAHEYYRDPVGGVDWKSKDDTYEPDYRDFAYLAFTVGMTYQVSDTDVTQSRIRHLVLGHALLSFVFGAVILATTVNLLAGLLNG